LFPEEVVIAEREVWWAWETDERVPEMDANALWPAVVGELSLVDAVVGDSDFMRLWVFTATPSSRAMDRRDGLWSLLIDGEMGDSLSLSGWSFTSEFFRDFDNPFLILNFSNQEDEVACTEVESGFPTVLEKCLS
jgi:hypothetical protein